MLIRTLYSGCDVRCTRMETSSFPRVNVSDAIARTPDSSSQKNSGNRTDTSRKRWFTLFAVTATKYLGDNAPEARPKPVMELIIARPSARC